MDYALLSAMVVLVLVWWQDLDRTIAVAAVTAVAILELMADPSYNL